MDDCVLNIRQPKVSKPKLDAPPPSVQTCKSEKNCISSSRKAGTQVKTASKVSARIAASTKQKKENRTQPPDHSEPVTRTSNPLQFAFSSGVKVLDNDKQTVSTLMSVPVEPRIEPVFSQRGWKEFLDSLDVHPHITSCIINRFKLRKITAIQEVTIPHMLERKDCLIRAQTGSGKTLAYAVPVMQYLMTKHPAVCRTDGVLALVILPTRELATQTYDVFQLLSKACVRVVSGCLIGGVKRKPQKVSLRKGLNIVVGTPQRILDHILRTVSLKLNQLTYLVIDEADRLLEMGFEKDVRRIIEHIHEVKNVPSCPDDASAHSLQTILLSATLTPGVEKLAGLTLRDPVRCMVKEVSANKPNASVQSDVSDTGESQFAMPRGLKHFVLVVPWKLRLTTLAAFILLKCQYHNKGGKLVVFMSTQDCVDFHHQLFKATLCPDPDDLTIPSHAAYMTLFRLHGNMEHSERQSVFQQFSVSTSGILLTTDVASRGLDLASVSWVVLYHVSGGPVDYVHRVGRTARAGGRGKALLFLSPDEIGFTDLLRSVTGIVFEQLSLPDLLHTAFFHMRNLKGKKKASCATVEEGVSQFSRMLLEAVEGDSLLQPLAGSAYTSFLRAYASFSGELRACFTFKRLHLGHVARAFCLQATPKDIAKQVTGRLHRDNNQLYSKSLVRSNQKSIGGKFVGKRISSMGFENAHAPKRPKLLKPADKAKRDMLAEFGL